jgi:uncharacterized protein with PIN domain
MLGSLSRWLRISGYNTLYLNNTNDEELLEKAKKTGRILLTRDSNLVSKSSKIGIETYLVEGDTILKRLIDLKNKLKINYSPLNSRCPRCNGELNKVNKEELKTQIPESSYNVFNDFWKCLSCEAVYWKGSHWNKIVSMLERANKNILIS